MNRLYVSLCATVLLLSSLTLPASGQVLYGSIVGNVSDASQAAVPTATVTVTNTGTNQSQTATTSASGSYSFLNLQAGTYTVNITAPNFQTFNTKDVLVQANSVTRVNATLAIGVVTQIVDISAQAALLQTDRADVSSEVNSRVLQNLPVTGRSYQSMLYLAPGVSVPDYFQSGGINNPSRSMTMNINGTANSAVVVRLEGVTATNQHIQNLQAYTPAIEAIETVNLVTSSFDAEQGMAGGASVNVQIKSGTNAFHGSAFEYVTNAAMRARGYYLPGTQKKVKDNRNVFGGTIGGPIKKDKLFFFTSVESTLQRSFSGGTYANETTSFMSLPLASIRGGDFSQTSTIIYDPTTGSADGSGRTPFGGNSIPLARQNSIVTQKILPNIPLPQFAGAANNYYLVPAYKATYTKWDTKMNWTATPKLAVMGRFSYLPVDETNSGYYAEGNPLGPGLHLQANVTSASVGATYTVSPAVLIDGVWGLTRQHTQQVPGQPRKCWAEEFGIKNVCQDRDYAFPELALTGWSTPTQRAAVLDYLDPQYQYAGNVAVIKGSHNIRFGSDIHRLHYNHYESTLPYVAYSFTGGVTALKGGASPNLYNSFADFLLGLPNSSRNAIMSPPYDPSKADPARPNTIRHWEFGFYVRDQWQVNRKLTLNLGLRWEYYPFARRADIGLTTYDFSKNVVRICGVGGTPIDCGVSVSKRLFSPRIGIAYRPTATSVIRAGFSLNPQQELMGRAVATNYPTVWNQNFNAPNTYSAVQSISDGFPVLQVPKVGSDGTLPLPTGSGATTYPSQYIRGYIMSWNFTAEQSIGKSFTAQVGYVGNRGIRLVQNQNQNYGLPGGGVASQPYYQKYGNSNSLSVSLPMQHTHYDSLQATLSRRMANGLQVNAGYTFGKAISNFAGGIPIPTYFPLNKGVTGRGDPPFYGLGTSGNTPHKFTLSVVHEPPFGRGRRFLSKGGVAAAVVGGWQVNAMFTALSGQPFSISASAASLNSPGSSQRADQVKAKVDILHGVNATTAWFDPLAFAPVTTARFGTAGYNTLYGATLVNLDAGLFRAIRLTERFGLQFRAEAFNVSNTPHFDTPYTRSVSNMQLNPDGSVLNLNGFGVIISTTNKGRDFDERYFRLGLRLSF